LQNKPNTEMGFEFPYQRHEFRAQLRDTEMSQIGPNSENAENAMVTKLKEEE